MGNRCNVVTLSALGAELVDVFYSLRWMVLLSVALILCDLWWGVSASRYRGEEIRFSKAGRRTANKLVDYLTYLILGAFIGLGVCEPLGVGTYIMTAAVGIGLGCLFEVDSIIGHVCEVHGVSWRFSLHRFLLSLVKSRQKDIGEAIEEATEEKEEKEKKEENT